MKLTKADRSFLRERLHEDDEHIDQIEAAIAKTIFLMYMNGEADVRITAKRAICILGRESFLSGMDRCAFHRSAVRTSDNGVDIYFDAGEFFRDCFKAECEPPCGGKENCEFFHEGKCLVKRKKE